MGRLKVLHAYTEPMPRCTRTAPIGICQRLCAAVVANAGAATGAGMRRIITAAATEHKSPRKVTCGERFSTGLTGWQSSTLERTESGALRRSQTLMPPPSSDDPSAEGEPALMLDERTYTFNLKAAFAHRDDADHLMLVQVARICVVYENFMLEVGEVQEAMAAPRGYDRVHRLSYFGFRVLASTWELKQAVDVLCMNPAFKERRKGFEARIGRIWDGAVKFFQANGDKLKAYRNDYAGHFTDGAAKHALDRMPPHLSGDVVVSSKRPGWATVRMPFAGQILAVGLTKDSPSPETPEEFLTEMMNLIVQAQNHALDVGHIIAAEFFIRAAEG